jgi:hypothetical protein
VRKAGLYTIRVSQESHQKFKLEDTKNGTNYAPTFLMVSKNNGIFTRLEAGTKETARDVVLKVRLSPGKYKVIVSSHLFFQCLTPF